MYSHYLDGTITSHGESLHGLKQETIVTRLRVRMDSRQKGGKKQNVIADLHYMCEVKPQTRQCVNTSNDVTHDLRDKSFIKKSALYSQVNLKGFVCRPTRIYCISIILV